jgi:hypothetical protein
MRQEGFRVSVVMRGIDAATLDRAVAELTGELRAMGGNPVEEDTETAQSSADSRSE